MPCHENASFPFLRQNTHLATAFSMQTVHGGQFPVARRAWWRYDCRTASSRSAWLRSSAVDQSTAISTNARWMGQSAWRHRRKVDLLLEKDATADFFLTQVVSHHDRAAVEQFLAVACRRQLSLPGVFGVFFYRSTSIETLKFLPRFLPVPAAKLTAEFEAAFNAVQICARSIAMLRQPGVNNAYVSNLPVSPAAPTLRAILFEAEQSNRLILLASRFSAHTNTALTDLDVRWPEKTPAGRSPYILPHPELDYCIEPIHQMP